LRAAQRPLRGVAQQGLDQVHQVMVVLVRGVKLDHGELGVVARGYPLVAEIAVDLEHTLEAAHDQALEVKLGRDAQVELDVERVVMGHERPRRRAARDGVHHRRLDLEIAVGDEEVAHRLHDARALGEHAPRVLV